MPRRLPETELIQLTDDTGSGQVNNTVVTEVLDEASALIDSYCRLRYTVPLQSSLQVKGLTLDLAKYLLELRRNRVREDTKQAYDHAVSFLRAVARGEAALDQPTGATAQSGGGPVKETEKEEKFSDENLGGFA